MQAADAADTLRRQIELVEVRVAENGFGFTASFGVAVRLPRHKSFQEIVSDADEALYRAKSSGRNCVIRATKPQELKAV